MKKCSYTANQTLLIVSNFIGGTDYTLDILRYTSEWGKYDTIRVLEYINSVGIKNFIESLNCLQTRSAKPNLKSKKSNEIEGQLSSFDTWDITEWDDFKS